MSLLVDTDTCSAYLRGNSQAFSKFIQYAGRIHLSVITLAELGVWARRPSAPAARLVGIHNLLQQTVLMDVDRSVADKFSEIRARQFSLGTFTPQLDLLIASTALVHGLTLVTHNVQDFATVPGLQIIDWLAP